MPRHEATPRAATSDSARTCRPPTGADPTPWPSPPGDTVAQRGRCLPVPVTYTRSVIPPQTRLLVSSGEPSGDLYAAELVRHLRGSIPSLEVFGLGGDHLAAQGAHLVAHVRDLAVVGLVEVLRHLRRLRRVFRSVLAQVERDAARPRRPRRLPGLSPEARPRAEAAGRAGRVLRLSATVGLAKRADPNDPRDRDPHDRDLPVRGGALPRGGRRSHLRRPPPRGCRSARRRSRDLPRLCRPRPGATARRRPAREPAAGGRAQPAAARRRAAPPERATAADAARARRGLQPATLHLRKGTRRLAGDASDRPHPRVDERSERRGDRLRYCHRRGGAARAADGGRLPALCADVHARDAASCACRASRWRT